MSEYKEVQDNEAAEWDSLVSHPLQSWTWGEFRKQRQEITRLGVYEEGKLIKGFLVIWTKTQGMTFGYVPMAGKMTEEDIRQLKVLGKKQKAIWVRTEPNVRMGEWESDLPKGRNLFKPKTYFWNLKLTEKELLENMHQKTRYNIRVAEKHGVLVKQDDSDEAFGIYQNLLSETEQRQGVKFHNKDYQEKMWKQLSQNKMAHLFIATYDKTSLSAMMIFSWRKNLYYAYGGNSMMHKEVMAPTKLLWEVARWGKDHDYEMMDLWGADEGKGFSTFKERFGAELVEMVGTYDIPMNIWVYKLMRVVEEIRWKVRHLK